MTSKVENKNVYIPNLQACDIYDHIFKGRVIEFNEHTGMLPYSIELRKLEQEGLKPKKDSHGKRITQKIINVKFKMNIKSAKKQLPELNESLEYHKSNLEKVVKNLETCSKKKKVRFERLINEAEGKIRRIESQIELLERDKYKPHMGDMNREELRKYLYENGFVINGTEYLPYKRSSAKSRKGEMTFIIKSLHEKMMKWSRMGLDFTNQGEIDYPALLAYESLVMSSILHDESGLVKIEPKNMLIIDDIEHVFEKKVNVVHNEKGYLDTYTDKISEVTSAITDGQSLLDARYFENTPDNGMKLLRNHFFKSCAFSCNIQQFLEDHKPDGMSLDEWIIKDKFENEIKASDIHFIFCPTSLKALKYSDIVGGEEGMYQYWKGIIEREGSLFGVCKMDKGSKLGVDEDGNILQQTTYQFLNSLPLSSKRLDDLLSLYEYKHIDRLKNDYDYFMDYVEENANMTNANQMMADLYKRNPEIIHSELFRSFKAVTVNAYVERVKKGKIKIPNADYATICSNPIEMLLSAIDKFDINNKDHIKNIPLKDNEVYCPLFQDGKELVCWRNPHTSQSNVLISVNRLNDMINKYINATDNIVIINGINHPIQPILSGSDQDGDTMALSGGNETLLEAAKECYGQYNVSVNKVPSSKKKYNPTYSNAAVIDNNLSKSTMWIGRVVNENQHILSLYWDRKVRGASQKELNHLIKQIDKFTILSEICIDLAKKATDINVDDEIDRIKERVNYKTDQDGNIQFPLFFKMVKSVKGRKKKLNTAYHETTMDVLFEKLSRLKYANKLENKNFNDFLVEYKLDDANREQLGNIVDITEQKIKRISQINQGDYEKDEKNRLLEYTTNFYQQKIRNLKIKPETMYRALLKISEDDNGMKTTLLNILYNHDKETFLHAFKKSQKCDGNNKVVA
jgi:hypothetical protein